MQTETPTLESMTTSLEFLAWVPTPGEEARLGVRNTFLLACRELVASGEVGRTESRLLERLRKALGVRSGPATQMFRRALREKERGDLPTRDGFDPCRLIDRARRLAGPVAGRDERTRNILTCLGRIFEVPGMVPFAPVASSRPPPGFSAFTTDPAIVMGEAAEPPAPLPAPRPPVAEARPALRPDAAVADLPAPQEALATAVEPRDHRTLLLRLAFLGVIAAALLGPLVLGS